MERLTIRIPEEIADEIDERQTADDVSQSEAVRTLLRRGVEYDRIREERDRYERQYQQLIEHREEHDELVRFAQDERQLRREDRELRRAKAQAGIVTRAKWWITGMPDTGGFEFPTADGGQRSEK